MTISCIEDEGPRERFARVGVELLSDADLLGLVLGAKPDGILVGRLVREYPTLTGLAQATADELASIPGIGSVRAAGLCAAIALGRRVDHASLRRGEAITHVGQVYHHFHARLGQLRQERFYVLLLDGKGRLLRELRVSEGTLTASLVHPREVFRIALREAAASLVLVHNHPSGDPSPSAEDEALTRRLRAAGDLLGVAVLDHVVLGRGRWLSFAETGRM